MARMRLTVKGECEEKCHKSAAEQKKNHRVLRNVGDCALRVQTQEIV